MKDQQEKMPFPDTKEDLTVFVDDLTEQMVGCCCGLVDFVLKWGPVLSSSTNNDEKKIKHSLISFSTDCLFAFLCSCTRQERRFTQMRTNIMSKLDEMGNRVDALERDLHSLASRAGMEPKDSSVASSATSQQSSSPVSRSPSGSPSSSAVEI